MSSSELESAILIKVPEVEHLVRKYRKTLDPSEDWGVPAHVTLLYPFLSPVKIDHKVLEQLEFTIGSQSSFEIQFLRTEWFGDEVLWLSPEPALPFHELMRSLFSVFTELLPYGDANLEPTPHLTVAYRANLKVMRDAALQINSGLPINASVGSVSVMTGSQMSGSWTTLAEIPLRVD